MSARDVKSAVNDAIGKALLRGDWPSERADTVLSALDAAGYAPPLLKAVIHRALQDAFQAGAKSALREDGPSITADKHKYCDAALSALQAKETS